MNIGEYLQTRIATHNCGITSSDKGYCIEVDNNLIILPQREDPVVINKILNVNGYLTSRLPNSVVVKSIINFNGSVEMSSNNIIPGTFIKKHIIDDSMPSINSLYINGYVMNNGVLS